MLIILFFSTSLLFVGGMSYLAYYYWLEVDKLIPEKEVQKKVRLSVIVVVRNEEHKISELLQDIASQSYERNLFEVLVVDDHSEDGTVRQVQDLISTLPFNLRLLRLQADTGKKAGLELGVKEAVGQFIAVTDGDCRLLPDWLEKIAAVFRERAAVFVAGPVTFHQETSLFERLQTIEFASLVGTGAAMLKAGSPGMCNAANMAFSREVYLQVLKSRTDNHIPSGDDEFLLQAIFRRYPERVYFLKDRGAVVSTTGHSNWQDFYQQRKRWAGKWRLHRKPSIMITAMVVYFLQLAWVLFSVAIMLNYHLSYFFAGLLLKFGAEFLFLRSVLRGFGKGLPLFPFLLLQLIYPFYVLFFGIAVNFGQFSWKGRTYNYAKL